MAGTSLIFRLIGVDAVTPATRTASAGFAAAGTAVMAASAIIAAESLKAAEHWETAMTRVVTGAGEAKAAVAGDSEALLKDMGKLGVGADALGAAFYRVNSYGFHAAEGLRVTEVAAMGAKTGAASLEGTAKALAGMLNAYGLSANEAAHAMNVLIGTEIYGSSTMEELASAFPKVSTAAAVAGISMEELGGAMSALTHVGLTADISATYLRQTITQLSAPTVKATKSMEQLGLNAVDVSKTLGKEGLGAAIDMLSNAIRDKMGPDGTVLMRTLTSSKTSADEFANAIHGATEKQRTYLGALADSVGGTKSMQAALILSTTGQEYFKKSTAGITEQVKKGGQEVEGFAQTQETLAFKLSQVKGTMDALGITLGNMLIPYAKTAAEHMYTFAQKLQEDARILPEVTTAVVALGTALAAARIAAIFTGIASALGMISAATAGSIGALVAPVLLLATAIGVGIYVAYQRVEWFRNGVDNTLKFVRGAWSSTVAFFEGLDLGPVVKRMLGAINTGGDLFKEFTADPSAMIQRLSDYGPIIIAAIKGWFKDITPILNETLVQPFIRFMSALPAKTKQAIESYGTFVAAGIGRFGDILTKGLGVAFRFALNLIKGFPKEATILFEQLYPLIREGFKKAPGVIGPALLAFGGWLLKMFVAIIEGLGPMIWKLTVAALGFLVQAIGFGLGLAVKVFAALPGFIGDTLILLCTVLYNLGGDALKLLVKAFTEGIPKLLEWCGSAIQAIIEFFQNIDWGKTGSDIITGLKNGIIKAAGGLVHLAEELATKLSKGFTDALGVTSPSKVFHSHGTWVVKGAVNGIRAGIPDAVAATQELGRRVSESFNPSLTTVSAGVRGYGGGVDAAPPGYKPGQATGTLKLEGDRAVKEFVRRIVKDGGGDVQVVFGTNGR
jgi:TP901 family phage tail tape measure protein